MLNFPGRREGGVATVEFYVVALLALLPLSLGVLQTALLLVANHHVDHAAFMATRQGAVRQGDVTAMRAEFARALTPLFVNADGPVDRGNVQGKVLTAYARALQEIAIYGRVRVLAPDARAQQDFGELRDGVRVIPNDALEHRSATLGRQSGLSLQEANILRVEFGYCRPLVVPFVRQFLLSLLRRIDADPWHGLCYLNGRVPIVSVGTAPMQSDYRVAGN